MGTTKRNGTLATMRATIRERSAMCDALAAALRGAARQATGDARYVALATLAEYYRMSNMHDAAAAVERGEI